MNCGLGNLNTLKRNLLGRALQSDIDFDSIIETLGLGVAGAFEAHCNREFTYAENYTEIFMGNRAFWFVKRYPFVSISKVELKYFASDNWTDITEQPLIINPETGQLNFGYMLGPAPLQVRVTYSGGYWFNTLEPDDANYLVCDTQSDSGYPAALPQSIQGSPNLTPPGIEPFKFLLPREIRTAWIMQCKTIWAAWDKVGLGAIDKPNAQDASKDIDLAPMVKSILQKHIRYQMT